MRSNLAWDFGAGHAARKQAGNMSALLTPTDALTEARALLAAGKYEVAVTLYEELLRKCRGDVAASLNILGNYQIHKEFLKCRMVFQMLSQKNLENGFSLDFGDYLLLDATPSPIHVSPAAIRAIDTYKGKCTSIEALKSGILERLAWHPNATTLIYCAHSVAGDLVDLCIISRNFAVSRIAEFGCGAGLQAMAFAKMRPAIQSIYLFEVEPYMQDSAHDVFKINGLANYHMNEPITEPVDCFYSFRACGFLFSVDAYLEQIRAARSPGAWAIMDIGLRFGAEDQRAKMLGIFKDATVIYPFGKNIDRHDRTLFDGVT